MSASVRKSTRLITIAALVLAMLLASLGAAAENASAPEGRGYFPLPSELGVFADDVSLPNLFKFLDPSADPDGSGFVDSPEEWPARAAELSDLLQYYVYGYKQQTPREWSHVVSAVQQTSTTWADGITGAPTDMGMWGSYFTELPALPDGSYTYSLLWGAPGSYTSFEPDFTYVADTDYDMPGSLADWKAGDTWAEHSDAYVDIIFSQIWNVDIEVGLDGNFDDPESVAAFRISVSLPSEEQASAQGVSAPFPALIATGSLSAQQILTTNTAGYGYIAAPLDGIAEAEYRKLYPESEEKSTIFGEDVGTKIMCSWTVSRALDALENFTSEAFVNAVSGDAFDPKAIITNELAVTGCSTGGKSALICGIFEPRVKIITASDPGGGGMTGFRYSSEGQLFSYMPPQQSIGDVHEYAYGLNESIQRAIQNSGEAQWFANNAQIFTTNPELTDNIPVDLHALVALCATDGRYFAMWTGEGQDAWLASPSSVLNAYAGREVYEYLGYGDRIEIVARDALHANQDRDLPDIIAIMDKAFRSAENYVVKSWDTLKSNAATGAAIDSSGTILPERTYASMKDMDRNPYYLPSNLLRWSRPDKYYLWTDVSNVTENISVDITFYTDAPSVALQLADGTEKTAEAVDGAAVISLTADEVASGQLLATASGSDKDPKSIEVRSWTTSDALRHASSDNSALGHDVGSSIAFTTPLMNYISEDNPVGLYLNDVELRYDPYDYDNKVVIDGETFTQEAYIQPYGATLILYQGTPGDALEYGEKVKFSLRNGQIEALSAYAIYFDIEFEVYNPNPDGTDGADGSPRKRLRTTVAQPDGSRNSQTPSWKPYELQNTPKSGLPIGEEKWPILGNWAADYNEDGTLKPVEEIRPDYADQSIIQTLYDTVITLGEATAIEAIVLFSEAVNPNDFAVAIKGAKIAETVWSQDAQTVRLVYESEVEDAAAVDLIVFRSADTEGNLLGAPVQLNTAN
jgi:hypothetical protein